MKSVKRQVWGDVINSAFRRLPDKVTPLEMRSYLSVAMPVRSGVDVPVLNMALGQAGEDLR